MLSTTKIALIGDYNLSVTAHVAIPKAIAIANKNNEQNVEGVWMRFFNFI